MASYKDFAGWAEVAQKIENNKNVDEVDVKPGVVYWFRFGVGIGAETLGKGRSFTRPGLVLALLTDDLLLVVPTTSRLKTGSNFEKIIVNGKPEFLILNQVCSISKLRIMDFVDEMDPASFWKIKRKYLDLRRQQLYKMDSPRK